MPRPGFHTQWGCGEGTAFWAGPHAMRAAAEEFGRNSRVTGTGETRKGGSAMNFAERAFCKFFKWANPDATERELAYYLECARQEFWRGIVEDDQLLKAYIALRLSFEQIYAAYQKGRAILMEFRSRLKTA